MTSNIQKLGNTLNARMQKVSGAAVPTTVELGTINANLSLTTDGLRSPIPKGSYMVDIRLAADTYRTEKTVHTHDGGSHTHSGGEHAQEAGNGAHSHSGGEHTHSGGSHDHRLPDEFRGLKAGDRVLVVWCGFEPVVVAIVKAS